ncbi:MAG: hypothetical protein AB1640_10025 [bacterium]
MEIDQRRILGVGGLLRRRILYLLVPSAALMAATILLAFLLPVAYTSSTTILAEESDIPEDLVGGSFNSFVNQRVDALTQLIMSRKPLADLIQRYNLYADSRRHRTIDEMIEKMKEDITFETNSTHVVPQGSGRPMQATLSFTITYAHPDPELAYRVTSELANLYVNQNAIRIERRLDETTTYLDSKKSELEQKITSLEREIARFKELHVNEMPELLATNLESLRSAEAGIEAQTAELLNLKERKSEIEGDLKKTKPYARIVESTGEKVTDPEDQLDALRFEYVSKRASMSDKHPDILALRKSIAEMETVVSRKQRLIDTEKRLRTLETQYADMTARMSPQHPDLIRTAREVRQLREELAALSQELAANQETAARTPDNPAYIDLQTQLKIANLNLGESQQNLSRLQERRRVLQARIQATPVVEEAFLGLTRDYENLKQQYQDCLTQISAATSAKGIEAERKGARFTILDPANLPETPSEPNVPVIFLLGLVLSLSAGLGSVYLAELTDSSVRTAEQLQSATGLPVLSAIPYVKDERDRRRTKWSKALAVVAAVLLLCFLGWAFAYYRANYA